MCHCRKDHATRVDLATSWALSDFKTSGANVLMELRAFFYSRIGFGFCCANGTYWSGCGLLEIRTR